MAPLLCFFEHSADSIYFLVHGSGIREGRTGYSYSIDSKECGY